MGKTMPTRPRGFVGWSLLAAVVLVVAIDAGVFFAAEFTARDDVASGFTWDSDEPLVIDSYGGCTITPESGEKRQVENVRLPRRLRHFEHVDVEPWFTGSAAVTCEGGKIWTGASARFAGVTKSIPFQAGVVASVVLLLFGYGLWHRRRR